MEFELDEYYFNRAGDKVKYVGTIPAWAIEHQLLEYIFRRKDGTLYGCKEDGRFSISLRDDHALDILGKWEITDDQNTKLIIAAHNARLKCS